MLLYLLYTNERGNQMNLTDKRERLVQSFTETYNAEELALFLIETYTDLMVEESYELFEGED